VDVKRYGILIVASHRRSLVVKRSKDSNYNIARIPCLLFHLTLHLAHPQSSYWILLFI